MTPFIQSDRALQITTPLGADALVLVAFRAREAVSALFHFEADTVWQGSSPIKFKDILGKSVTAAVRGSTSTRHFNGIVNSISEGVYDRERDVTHYTLRIVPDTWFLDQTQTNRIFQNKSVPDIVQQILAEKGLSGTLKMSLTGTYNPREYCVQYRESDFAFINRLMEDEGIFYFYQHTNGSHTLVLGDSPTVFADLEGGSDVEFEEVIGGVRDDDRIYSWSKSQEYTIGKVTMGDWSFETPSTHLNASSSSIIKLTNNGKLECYDYPGGYDKQGDADPLAKIRMQAEEAEGQINRGTSTHPQFCPGYKFNLKNHSISESNGSYTLIAVTHTARQPIEMGGGAGGGHYDNQFECIPADVHYRPPIVTPLPAVRGVETAIVVGPGGEEIYTDKYGRVKVQFHWDREGKNDENSSCWCRVATYWAGKQWGAIHIPRIGQEVVIDFVNGDVDHPLIVGSVYNAMQMPPYDLPGNATQSGIKSRSSKGGGAANFNEIRIEDKKGAEQIFMHAEKDLITEVENDETRTVDHDRVTTVKNDETQTVTNNETITVKQGNQSITLEQGNQSTVLKMGNQSTELKMGDQSIKLSMGNQTTNLDLGAASTEAMQSITLKVGQSKITIDQMGITMEGMMISIKGQVQVQVQGVMVQVSGTAMTTVKGGIVMIN
ncbi:MAG TPA: type VI secretion system Vgr family protein [Candidatus Limnocylindrales bacterium]|nr:type VI secretion system Vgr family protein [Candidatus Limnocylindrales bacterium]